MNYSWFSAIVGVLSIFIVTLYPFVRDLKIPFWDATEKRVSLFCDLSHHTLDFAQERNLYRGLYGLQEEYDLIIVGAGLSGSVIAEQASSR